MDDRRDLVVRARRVLTDADAEVRGPALVLVRGGRVADVDTTGAAPPPAAELVDLGDVTLLPGFVDAHVHLGFDAGPDVLSPLLEDDDATLLDRMRRNARAALSAGVTTVRDLGDRRFLSLALRDELATAPASGPELLVAGPPITRRQGHCWFLGGEAEGEDELRAAVAERAERACDVVKVMATGGVITPGFLPHEPQYGADDLTIVADAARQRGLPVAAHAHGPDGVRAGVAARVSSIEHCTFFTADGIEVDWEAVQQMSELGIYAGLTIAIVAGSTPPPQIAARIDAFRGAIARMHEIGVPLVCSSDAGVAPQKPHDVLPQGIVELAGLGLTNAEALAAATTTAAEACGVGDRKGRIAPGFDADLVAVRGNPLHDIGTVRDMVAVFRAGVRVR